MSLLSSGLTFKETAVLRGVAIGTVLTHAKRAYRKLGAHTKAEAVALSINPPPRMAEQTA